MQIKLLYCLLYCRPVRLLSVSSISLNFASSFSHFLMHWSPLTFTVEVSLKRSAIFCKTSFFVVFPFLKRCLKWTVLSFHFCNPGTEVEACSFTGSVNWTIYLSEDKKSSDKNQDLFNRWKRLCEVVCTFSWPLN